jgi:hypothetical protein
MNFDIERFPFESGLTLGSKVHYLFSLFALRVLRFFMGLIVWDLERELRFEVLNVLV